MYRGGFPVYGSYVSIPQNRAVRLSSERVSLLDSNGNLCLGRSSQKRTLKEGIEDNIIELNTTVNYTASPGNVTKFYGVNHTVSLEDIKEQNFTMTTRVRYNVTVADNSDCTQVEKEANGTMVQLFEFNPKRGNTANINTNLLIASVTLSLEFLIKLNLHKFKGLKVEGQGRIQKFLMGSGAGGGGGIKVQTLLRLLKLLYSTNFYPMSI